MMITNRPTRHLHIALQPEEKPGYLRPVDYWNLDKAFSMYPELPPLAYDENPYHPSPKAPEEKVERV